MSQPIKKMNQPGKNMSEPKFSLNQTENEVFMGGRHQDVGLAGVFLGRGPVEKRVLTVLI
jgi:hypothetical protein